MVMEKFNSTRFVDWLASKGIPFADLTAFGCLGEILSGIGILIGGLIGMSAPVIEI